ncbi:MAG: hypothetical protein FVQ84_09190 [Planctomycetes bacterium]|nr:hypothetical protein [Planctomycetota bacterium]
MNTIKFLPHTPVTVVLDDKNNLCIGRIVQGGDVGKRVLFDPDMVIKKEVFPDKVKITFPMKAILKVIN